MKTDKPQPNLKTPDDQLAKNEQYKLGSNYAQGHLHEDFRNLACADLEDESEQLAKSHGIYLEYNRAKTGREKDWAYMVRMSVPGGGAFSREQWRILDELSSKFTANPEGKPSLRVTTRQNIQFHWVKKNDVVAMVRGIASTGFYTLNGCGDNTRNVMACPLSKFSPDYNAHALAHHYGAFFRLPAEAHIKVFEIDTTQGPRNPDPRNEDALDPADVPGLNGKRYQYGPRLLNRKFKIAFSTVHRNPDTGKLEQDNCVECRTDEIGVCPVLDDAKEKVVAYMVFIGGSQGEKNGKTTYAAFGKPFGVFTRENLQAGMNAIVKVQEEWGDRENRHWARMKYVIEAKGIAWYQAEARARGAVFEAPIPDFDPGPRQLHHGWHTLPSGLLAFGAYIENGRIIDAPGDGNGNLKQMFRHLMDAYPIEVMTTPNQDALFVNIPPDAKKNFEGDLARFGFGQRNGKPYSSLRLRSGACVGLYTCRLSYTESEQFEPELLDQLDTMGYGEVTESIGITGCERQCFRPATKTLGWVGQGPDLYALKVGGSEDGRRQGFWLTDEGRWHLRQVPRDKVAVVSAALFDHYLAQRTSPAEDMGSFIERIGVPAIVAYLKANPATAPLMHKTADAPYRPVDGSDCYGPK